MKATVKGGCTSAAARRAAPSVKHSARRVGSQPRSALSNASASCLSSSNNAILKISSNIKKGRTGRNALTALPKWRQKDGRIFYPPPCEIDHISRFDDIFRAEKPHLRHRRIFLSLFYHISFVFSRGAGLPLTGERATTHAAPSAAFRRPSPPSAVPPAAFHAAARRPPRPPLRFHSPPFAPALFDNISDNLHRFLLFVDSRLTEILTIMFLSSIMV